MQMMRYWRPSSAYAVMAMLALQLLIPVSYQLEQGGAAAMILINPNKIQVHDIPKVVKRMGLKLRSHAAERAFFAKDYSRVSYADFRALWARAEKAKRDEAKLIAQHASQHTIICNKLLKVGTEAVMYKICKEPGYAHEHVLKFRRNLPLAGKTCRHAGL